MTACVNYTGYIHIRTGRAGVVRRNGVSKPAYVWAFLDAGGVLTDEKPYVIHSCDNPACMEVTHLRAGSPQDNMDDKMARGRYRGAPLATHCPQGHPYEGPGSDVRLRPDGGRRCRTCQREAMRRYSERQGA